jgi:photosystem II stability/assembly factor-like uncharacterized protein
LIARLTVALLIVAAAGPSAASAANCASAPGGGLTLANVAADGPRVGAVGSNGLMARAKQLGRWRVIGTPVEHNLRGIVWTGERWVLAGDIGTILSGTGGDWLQAPGVPNSGLRGIAARPGLVAASGSNGVVMTSPDGLDWSQANAGTTEILWGGTAVGSELWLSGRESTVIRSADGVAWSQVPAAPAPTDSTVAPRPLLWQLASDGVRVVAVGDFGAILEGDENGLSAVASPTDEILRGVAFGAGRWVAVGSGGKVLYSDDGRTWQLVSAPTTVDLRGVAWTGSRFVAVGDQSTVISSKDGRTWREEVTAMPCALLGVAFGDGRYIAVGGAGKEVVSANGRRWKSPGRITDADLYGIDHGPGQFVAVGSAGKILTSDDRGATWTRQRSHTKLNLHTVFWTGDEYLAGGDIGRIYSSPDGQRWDRVTSPAFHSIRHFATDGATVIAAGAGTIAVRAPGSDEWVLNQTGFARFQTGIAYGDGRWVVVGHNGEALVSTDSGTTWSQVSAAGVEVNFDAVVWTGSRFLATGEGVAVESVDGTSWAPVDLGTRRSVRALVAHGGAVVGVGDGRAKVRLPAG